MSKIAVCYFSYHGDKDFLNLSLNVMYNTIQRHPEHEVRVYVFDDARCDKHLKKKELYGEPTLISTHFDRQGNLNGYECIEGMFTEYKKIYDKFNFDYLIKLDSDCCVNSFDYIYYSEEFIKKNNLPLEKLGQIGTYFAQICCHGCCQTFTKLGVMSVYNLFVYMNRGSNQQEKVMKKRVQRGYNEDKVVSVLLEMAPVLRINLDYIPEVKGHINSWTDTEADYSEYTSVAFKPNRFIKEKQSREESLAIMRNFVEDFCG